MSKAQLTSICILLPIQHLIFVLSLMQIGRGVQPHGDPSLDTVRFLEEISSPGVQKTTYNLSVEHRSGISSHGKYNS